MILITYTRHTLADNHKKLDFTSVDTVEDFIDWFLGLGDKHIYQLSQKNRVLSQNGWNKMTQPTAFLMQAYDSTHKMLITIEKIVSDEGILYENVKHCSSQIVDCMALKCVKT